MHNKTSGSKPQTAPLGTPSHSVCFCRSMETRILLHKAPDTFSKLPQQVANVPQDNTNFPVTKGLHLPASFPDIPSTTEKRWMTHTRQFWRGRKWRRSPGIYAFLSRVQPLKHLHLLDHHVSYWYQMGQDVPSSWVWGRLYDFLGIRWTVQYLENHCGKLQQPETERVIRRGEQEGVCVRD